MICLSVSRSPHASARPSSVASISTRRACATSLKHSSPCPPRPTASPPPTSPLGCAFSANKALFRTAPATLPTISKNSAANRSFSGSPALAGTTHSRPAFAQWPPSWCFATKPSNPCSLPLNLSAQLAARTTRDPSTPTTVSYRLPCTASFTSSALPLEYRQFFCTASPLSAYWAQHPPLHLLAASYLGLGKSNNSAMASKLTEPKQRPSSDVSSMLARLGSGFTAGDVHAGLSRVILD